MPDESQIAAAGPEPALTLCPNCSEPMAATAKFCSACGLPVDWKRKQESEEEKKQVKKAGDQAYAMMLTAIALIPFYLMHYLPFVGLVGSIGFLLILVVVPSWAIRWWDKHGKLESTSAEYTKAKNTVLIAGTATTLLLIGLLMMQVYMTASNLKL